MGASSGVVRAPQLYSGIRNHNPDFLLVQRYILRKKPSNPTSPLSAALLAPLAGFLFLSAGGRRHGSGAAVIVSPAPPGEGASTDVRTAALRAPVRTHSHPGGVGQTPAQPAVSEPNQVRQCTCVRGDVSRSSRPRLILG